MLPCMHITIPAHRDYLNIVRLTLFGFANKVGFSFQDIEDMKIAVSEACNNAVLHAYHTVPPGSIKINFDMEQRALRISIKDKGKGFDYKQALKRAKPHHEKKMNELKVEGLGIFLMQALMDKVIINNNNNGTEVILLKNKSFVA